MNLNFKNKHFFYLFSFFSNFFTNVRQNAKHPTKQQISRFILNLNFYAKSGQAHVKICQTKKLQSFLHATSRAEGQRNNAILGYMLNNVSL